MRTKMNWFKRLRVRMALGESLTEEAMGILAKLLPAGVKHAPYRGVAGMLTAYSKSPWVRAAVSKIAHVAGSTRWYLFASRNASGKYVKNVGLQSTGIDLKALSTGSLDIEGELVPIIDHPFLRLMNATNPMYPGYIGRQQTFVSIDLSGEAFWLLEPIERQGQMVPERYWLLPSTWVTGMPNVGDPTWEIQTPYWSGKLPAQAIFRFVDPDPVNPYARGSAHLRAFGDEIDTDEFAAQHVKSWFLNKARPDILITGEGMSQPDTQRMEQRWLSEVRGFVRQHKPFFLNRKVDVHELSQKFSDMELTDLRKWERDIIIHGLGMPPEILGIVENSNRATINAADYILGQYVVTPRLELMRNFLQYLLIPMYDDRLIVAYESPVQEDREYQLEVAKAVPYSRTLNEWRTLGGEEPRDDGDVFAIPFNVRLVSTLTPDEPLDTLGRTRALKTLSNAEGCSHGREIGPGDRAAPDDDLKKLTAVLRQVGGPDTTRLALKLSDEMAAEIVAAFDAVRNSIDIRALSAAFETGDINLALKIIEDAQIADSLEPARQILREALVVVGEAAAEELSAYVNFQIAFELTNPEAVAFLEAFGAEMVTNVTDETMAAVHEILRQAYEEGITGDEAARRIVKEIGLTARDEKQLAKFKDQMRKAGLTEAEIEVEVAKFTKAKIRFRAQVIADNELVHAGNKGQEVLWEQAQAKGAIPSDAKREWIVTPDDRLCVLCSPMAGVRTGVNQPYPSEPPVFTPSDIHVKCRCSERLIL